MHAFGFLDHERENSHFTQAARVATWSNTLWTSGWHLELRMHHIWNFDWRPTFSRRRRARTIEQDLQDDGQYHWKDYAWLLASSTVCPFCPILWLCSKLYKKWLGFLVIVLCHSIQSLSGHTSNLVHLTGMPKLPIMPMPILAYIATWRLCAHSIVLRNSLAL